MVAKPVILPILREIHMLEIGLSGGVAGALEAGRSRVRFLMRSYFSLTYSFRPHTGPGVHSASDKYWHHGSKDSRCVGLTTLPP